MEVFKGKGRRGKLGEGQGEREEGWGLTAEAGDGGEVEMGISGEIGGKGKWGRGSGEG